MPFSQEAADIICDRLAKGESLRRICGEPRDPSVPGMNTVFRWLAENDTFAKQYARARDVQADTFVDEIVAIADGEVGPTDDPARDRLRIDARKWVAARMAPKKYGDKVQTEHTGAVEITRIEHVIVDPAPRDDA